MHTYVQGNTETPICGGGLTGCDRDRNRDRDQDRDRDRGCDVVVTVMQATYTHRTAELITNLS